jgi:hypothetical protein
VRRDLEVSRKVERMTRVEPRDSHSSLREVKEIPRRTRRREEEVRRVVVEEKKRSETQRVRIGAAARTEI